MARQDFALDYIDVATRIVEFRTKHPEGSLQQYDLQFIDFAGKGWVVYTAAAYRTPDDPRPGIGTAWEPVPGPTSFTKDSEVQNAETAAWGRAIVAALAADTKRGVASAEEVRNRQEVGKGKSPADPLVEARNAVHAAYLTRHQTFDRDKATHQFEAWAAVPFADASPEQLHEFAEKVKTGEIADDPS
jgi:hypothetical protein